ncbi:helix-turn-helix domain-containing protein [Pseudoglutamicibacter cumminsii]|uniref:helix-turn-helix domain-containing protein n=1 Tax=Pseudoglutamicibacter cumminsii TaxID=156979 RepID=UPI0021A4F87C|nr:helix-turn-helix domain-containing protein [Pseudoglutamicibacter cumminsii]MCT1685489.1 helix-turn-helix domain-containing protein [Pseudoglutamicibacter cumminsii]
MTLTVQQVADRLQVSPYVARQMVQRGDIKGFKLTDSPRAQWRIPARELENFIQRRTAATTL